MILIITFKEDYTADFVVNSLNKRNIDYKRLNCDELLTYPYNFQFSDNGTYSIMGESNFDTVWFRRTKIPELSGLSFSEKTYLYQEIDALIKNIFCVIEARWVSEPFAVYKAENKFLQLKTAIQLGFKIPETLVTNSKEELLEFYSRNNENIIIKPISQTRINYPDEPQFIFTNRVTKTSIENLASYDLTPCIFQANIVKEYEIRVTVVGDKLFPAAIYSQENEETLTDWRRKKLQFQPIELPIEISQKCVQLVKMLNLQFGAIDLIKDILGNYIFLEINPNGQWAWIESQTGMLISDAIIEELS